MASKCECSPEVTTVLGTGLNLMEAGNAIQLRLSKIQKQEEDSDPIMASARCKSTGTSDVSVQENNKVTGSYIVQFMPTASDEYTLDVMHHGEHVPGSPFPIMVVEKGSLAADHSSLNEVTVGLPLNLILSTGDAKIGLAVSVKGPNGVCDSSIDEATEGRIAVNFVPTIPGDYTVRVTANGDEDITGGPFKIRAAGTSASRCHILEEDMHLFKQYLRLGRNPALFRISTAAAGEGTLDIVSKGPGVADVKICKNGNGTETCEFKPSVAGKYHLDILWNGEHIEGSPYMLNFRRPKTQIISSGLNLQYEIYRIGVSHRFKMNCEGAGEGALKLTCKPESAAKIGISTKPPNSYVCEIIPLEVGNHEIVMKYKGKHIMGSPFQVHFSPNAAKCQMIDISNEHEVGSSVMLQISTEGAGKAKLTASIENAATNEAIPVDVSQISDELYSIAFNPGQGMECQLTVKYSNEHIRGSPFKLIFSEPSKCIAEGEGLASAQVGQVSKFSVKTENAGPGVLKVNIEGETDTIESTTAVIDTTEYEVSYRPTQAGTYKISIQWGKFHIPGSPFTLNCYDPSQLSVKDFPSVTHVDKETEFTIEAAFKINQEDLAIEAKATRGEMVVQGTLKRENDNTYVCSLTHPVAGKYMVNVHSRGEHIQGSPFKIRVLTPPIPEKVKAFGPGLEDGVVGQEGKFSIVTTDAGTGMLAVRVHGPKGAFKINTSRHPEDERTILIQYDPTRAGEYTINVTWSGTHIPGSPFKVKIREGEEEGKEEGEGEKQDEQTEEGKEEAIQQEEQEMDIDTEEKNGEKDGAESSAEESQEERPEGQESSGQTPSPVREEIQDEIRQSPSPSREESERIEGEQEGPKEEEREEQGVEDIKDEEVASSEQPGGKLEVGESEQLQEQGEGEESQAKYLSEDLETPEEN